MLLTCLLAMTAVVLGAVLGIGRSSPRSLSMIRTAGLGSGCLAVFGQLLPEAVADLGYVSLVPFTLALGASTFIERAFVHRDHGHRHGRDDAGEGDPERASERAGGAISATLVAAGARASIELGFAALAAHQLVEGLALGAIVLESPGGRARIGLALALAAHTVPIVAMLALALRSTIGLAPTLLRLGGLAVVSVAGVASAALPLSKELLLPHEGWVHAAVAGLLLHAVLHAAAPPSLGHAAEMARVRDYAVRALDVFGFVFGAALVGTSVIATGTVELFRSAATWVVLVLSIGVAVVVNRAWPHVTPARAVGA